MCVIAFPMQTRLMAIALQYWVPSAQRLRASSA